MLPFRSANRVVVAHPTSLEELPLEIIQVILGHMDFADRQSLRKTSCQFRQLHDNFVEHRVNMTVRQTKGVFMENFCRMIHENTTFFRRIAFPQFMSIFVCPEDLSSISCLHSSTVAKILDAKFIGDISDVFEKMMLNYLSVVQAGCGSQRNKFKFLLVLTILNFLQVGFLIR